MKYNPENHRRRSIRLQGYDYSKLGAYFITICVQNRECLFGNVVGRTMVLADAGKIVADEWIKTSTIRGEIELGEWVVMPNHFHSILIITSRGTAQNSPKLEQFAKPIPGSIPTIVRSFKSGVTKRINELRQTPGQKLWQRNYWEHIIRNESEWSRVRQYIQSNPAQWELDKLHPDNWAWNGRGRLQTTLRQTREPCCPISVEA